MYNLTEHNEIVNKALKGKTFDQAIEICQDLEGIQHEITQDVYFEKLGSLPPYKWTKSGFLFGAFSFGPYVGHYFESQGKFWYSLVHAFNNEGVN